MNDPVLFIQKLNGSASIAVPKNDFVYTDTYKFGDVNDFAIVYQVSCTGIPNVKIQMQQSIDNQNWFIPNAVGDIETSLTSKSLKGGTLNPVTVPYIRFKITEQTNLVTDTVVNITLSLQKKFSM